MIDQTWTNMDVNFNEQMADEAIARLSLPERLTHFAMRIKGGDEPYWLMQEASKEIVAIGKERDALKDEIKWIGIASQTDRFFAECSLSEEIVSRCQKLLGVESGDEIFTPMPESCQRFACREHHPKLVKLKGFMVCPRCYTSYGNAVKDNPEKQASHIKHGVNCDKVLHPDGSTGWLHDHNDDQPYCVDGLMYCGRCHGSLPE